MFHFVPTSLRRAAAGLVAATLCFAAHTAAAATITAAQIETQGSFDRPVSPRTMTFDGSSAFTFFTDLTTVRDYTLSFRITADAERYGTGQMFQVDFSDTLGPESMALQDFAALPSVTFSPIFIPGVNAGFTNVVLNPGTMSGTADISLFLGTTPSNDLIHYVIPFDPDFGFNGTYQVSATLTYETAPAVPLPASLPMLIAGLGGLVALRRRIRT